METETLYLVTNYPSAGEPVRRLFKSLETAKLFVKETEDALMKDAQTTGHDDPTIFEYDATKWKYNTRTQSHDYLEDVWCIFVLQVEE